MARQSWRAACCLVLVLLAHSANAYSVLTHEQIIDDSWESHIQPQLLRVFPNASAEELTKARAFAYGGCLIQDLGYYRFGNRQFSDLTHYVRTGDFVASLIANAGTIEEYAFALGALAHYASDNTGHPVVNRIVPLQFPKLARKFGAVVRYADDRKTHIRSEFGFDVLQVAKNRYTAEAWRSRIGFEVPPELLYRAFQETYGLSLDDVFSDLETALGTYRWAITEFVPEATKVALKTRRDEIEKAAPNFDEKTFVYRVSRADFEKTWGKKYKRPGFLVRTAAFLVKILPKVGPLRGLVIQVPQPHEEQLYRQSYEETLARYGEMIRQVSRKDLSFPNRDFDTGEPSRAGEYPLADQTYAALLEKLAEDNFASVSSSLRENILHFYSMRVTPVSEQEPRQWDRTEAYVTALRNQSQ